MNRMKGKVTRLVQDRGYGFLVGEGGKHSRFFHAKDVEPRFQFETMSEGQDVTFIPDGRLVNGTPDAVNNGLRARQVRICT